MKTTCLITLPITVLAMLLATTTLSQAQDVLRYRQGGTWTNVSDGVEPGWGFNPDLPGSRVPTGTDEARVNWGGSTVMGSVIRQVVFMTRDPGADRGV